MANQPIYLKIANVTGTENVTGTLSIVNCDSLQVITVSGYTFNRQISLTPSSLATGVTVEFSDIPENIVIPANHKVKLAIMYRGKEKIGYGPCQANVKAVCIVPTICNLSIKGFEKVSNTQFKVKLNSSAVGPFSAIIKKEGMTKLSKTGLVGLQVGVILPSVEDVVFEAWKSGELDQRRKLFDIDGLVSKAINTVIAETVSWTFFALIKLPFDKFIFSVTRPDLSTRTRTFFAGYITGARRISWLEDNYGETPKIGTYLFNLKLYRNDALVIDESATLNVTADVPNVVPIVIPPYEVDKNYNGGVLEEVETGQDFNGVPFKRSQALILDGVIRLSPRPQGNFYEFEEQTAKNVILTKRFPKNYTIHPNRPFGWMGPFAKDLTDRRTLLTRGVTHFGRIDKAIELNLPSNQIWAFLFGAEVSDSKTTTNAAYLAGLELERINPADPRVASLKRYGLENRPDNNLGAYIYLGKYIYNSYYSQVGNREIPFFTVNIESYEGTAQDFVTSQEGIQRGIVERARELGHKTTNLTYGTGSFIFTVSHIGNGQLRDNYFQNPMPVWGNFNNDYSTFAQSSGLYEGRDQYVRATWDNSSLFQKNADGSLKLGANGRHVFVYGRRTQTIFGMQVDITENESQHYSNTMYDEFESILVNWRFLCNTSLTYDGSQVVGDMPYPEGTGNLRPGISNVKHTSLFRDSTEGFEGPIRDMTNNGALVAEPLNWDWRPVNKRIIESIILARGIFYHSTGIWSYRFNPKWEWGQSNSLGDNTALGQFEIMLKGRHRSQNFPELFDLMDSNKIDFIIPRRFIYKGNEVKGDYCYEKPIVWFLKEKLGRRLYCYWVWPVQDMGDEHERDMKFWIELQNGNKTKSYSFKFKNREAGFERILLPEGFESARSQDCYFQFKSLINETITWKGNYNYIAPLNVVAPPLYDGAIINNPIVNNTEPTQHVGVIGNSILHSDAVVEFGFTGGRGMAASSNLTDFKALLLTYLKTKKITNQLTPILALNWESTYETNDLTVFAAFRNTAFTKLIIRLGENINNQTVLNNPALFKQKYKAMIDYILNGKDIPVVLTTSLWVKPNVNVAIREVANERGYVLADIESMWNTASYFTNKAGNVYEQHPNDSGMTKIATTISNAIDNSTMAEQPVPVETNSALYVIPDGVDQWPLTDGRIHPMLSKPIGPYVEIKNEFLEVRIWKEFGGAICHIAKPGGINIINNYDLGRQVNDVLYRGGRSAISLTAEVFLIWATPEGGGVGNNPIISGNVYDQWSDVIKMKFITNGVYTETRMRNWAVKDEYTDVILRRWVRLIGREIRINEDFVNFRENDKTIYEPRQQEMPCAYVNKTHYKAAYYDGAEPWKNLPLTYSLDGNLTPKSVSENFIAILDAQDEGIGITNERLYSVTNEEFAGASGEFGSGANYIAGIPQLNISWNEKIRYEYTIIVGHINQIRETVYSIPRSEKPIFRFDSIRNRNGFTFEKSFDTGWPVPNTGLSIRARDKRIKLVSCLMAIKPVNIPKLYIRFAAVGTVTAYRFGWFQVRQTDIQQAQSQQMINFTAIPDGQYRTIVLDLQATGSLTEIVTKFYIHHVDISESPLASTEGFDVQWTNVIDADPAGSFIPVSPVNPCNFSNFQVIGKWGSDDVVALNFANQWWIGHKARINNRDSYFIRGTNFLKRNDVITTFGLCADSFAGGVTAYDGLVPPESFQTPVGYTKYTTADLNTYYQLTLIA